MSPIIASHVPVIANSSHTDFCWRRAGYTNDPTIPSGFDPYKFISVAFSQQFDPDDLVLGQWDDGSIDWVLASSVYVFGIGARPISVGFLHVIRDIAKADPAALRWWVRAPGPVSLAKPLLRNLSTKLSSHALPAGSNGLSTSLISAAGATSTSSGPKAPTLVSKSQQSDMAWTSAGYQRPGVETGFNDVQFKPIGVGRSLLPDDFVLTLTASPGRLAWERLALNNTYHTINNTTNVATNSGDWYFLREVGSIPASWEFPVSPAKGRPSYLPYRAHPVNGQNQTALLNYATQVQGIITEVLSKSVDASASTDWTCTSPACRKSNTTSPAGYPCWKCGSKR